MAAEKVNVVIIGGSLAGLFTAISLQTLSKVSSITILERYQIQDLQDLGAGIRCNDEAVAAIHSVGSIPPEKYAISIKKIKFLQRDGTVPAEQPTNSWTTTWGQLYRAFREKVDESGKITYRHGCTLTDLSEASEDTVQVEFEDENQQRQKLVANLVIGADGASSKVRSLMDASGSKRTSAGYAVYRGVVPEESLSSTTATVFENSGVFAWLNAGQFLSYAVPSNGASADKAGKSINWVWYRNKSDEELKPLLTDTLGKLHKFTLPHGKMRKEVAEQIREEAKAELPDVCIEVIEKTSEPFIQVCTDSMASKASAFNGKLALVGDAIGGQRPHTASAIMQGSHHALLVRKYLEGTIDASQLEEQSLRLSKILVDGGQKLGSIIMIAGPRTPTTIGAYMKTYLGIQAELNAVWRETIGEGEEIAKM